MKKDEKNKSFTWHWRRQGYLMTLPALLIVIIFMIIPFIANIGYAFTNYSLKSAEAVQFVGLKNFQSVFKDRNFSVVLKNTIKMCFVYMVVINIVALTLSVLISNVGRGYGNTVKTIVYFPQLLSMVVVGFLWRIMLNYKHGAVNTVLKLFGMPADQVPQWLGDKSLIIIPSIAMACIWLVAGYYTTVYHAAILAIPKDYYEVATIDGASRWQEFWYVTLPSIMPSVKINTVLLTIESLSVFALPAAMTDGGGPGVYGTTFALWAYNTYFGNMQYGKAIAMSVLIGLVAILFALVEMRLLKGEENG